jgi:hypothetical protein
MTAYHLHQPAALDATSAASVWDNNTLYTTLNSVGVHTQPPSIGD